MAQWYYAIAGQRYGPVGSGDLKKLADAGELSPDDLIHKQGQAGWAKAKKVKGLFPEGAPSRSKPQAVVETPAEPEEQIVEVEAAPQEQPAPPQQPIMVEKPVAVEQPIAVAVTPIQVAQPSIGQTPAAEEQPAAAKQPAAEEILVEEQPAESPDQGDALAELAGLDSSPAEQSEQEQSPEDIFAETPTEPSESEEARPQAAEPAEDPHKDDFLLQSAESAESEPSAPEQKSEEPDQTDTPVDLEQVTDLVEEPAPGGETEEHQDLQPVSAESEGGDGSAAKEEDPFAAFEQQESSASEESSQPATEEAEAPQDNLADLFGETSSADKSAGQAGAEDGANIQELSEDQLFEEAPAKASEKPTGKATSASAGFAESKSKAKPSTQSMEEFDSSKTMNLEGLRARYKPSRLPALFGLILALVALVPTGVAAYFIFFPNPAHPTYSPAVLMDTFFLAGSGLAALGLLMSLLGLIAGLTPKFASAISLAACAIQAVIFLPPFLPGNAEGKQAYITASLVRFGQAVSAYQATNNDLPADLSTVTPANRLLPGDLKCILMSAGPAGEFYYIKPATKADASTIIAFDRAGLNQASHVVLYSTGAVAVRTDKEFQDELDLDRNSAAKKLVSDERRKIAEELEAQKSKPEPEPKPEPKKPAAQPGDLPGEPGKSAKPANTQPSQDDPFKDTSGKKSFFES